MSTCAAGCTSDRFTLHGPDLPAAVAFAALLLEDAHGAVVGVSGLAERSALTFEIELPAKVPPDAVTVTVLAYAREDIEPLLAGATAPAAPLRLAVSGEAILPAPAWIGRGPWGGPLAAVASSSGSPELTASWLGPCPDPCTLVPIDEVIPVSFPPASGDGVVAIPWDHGSDAALVLTNTGRGLRVTTTTATALPISAVPAEVAHHGALAEDGTIWIGTTRDRLFRGRPEVGFEWVSGPAASATAADAQVAIAPDGSVITVSAGGFVERYDGVARVVLHRAELGRYPETRHDIVAHPSGTIVATLTRSDEVLVLDGDAMTIEREVRAPWATAYVEGLGLVIGTNAEVDRHIPATLYLRGEDGSYAELAPPATSYGVERIFPVAGGFFFGGIRGWLGYYRLGVGACPQSLVRYHNLRAGVRLTARHLLLVGSTIVQEGPSATILVLGERATVRCAGRR
ncbi:MAG: hypothetical protein IT384_08755 [Deltaproteobacteria bacterium]|nr:hypothetical protein [Deltaproteobacteria bacterium]